MGRLVQPVPQKFRIPYFHTMGSSSLLPQQDGQTGRSQFPFNISGGEQLTPFSPLTKKVVSCPPFGSLMALGLTFSIISHFVNIFLFIMSPS